METVTEEHNLDIETMRLSRLPLEAAAQTGDSALQQLVDSAIKDHVGYSVVANANPGSSSSSPSEPSMGTTKSGFSVASSGGLPSKEQLRQLRAQCLIFLGFKNGLVPKKLHLEVALGNIYFKEGTERASFCCADGTRGDLIDTKGKEQLVRVEEVPRPLERQR